MPRKQRFKPSRKPKPVWQSADGSANDHVAGVPAADHSAIEQTGAQRPPTGDTGDIESGAQARSTSESSASVIEDVGSTGR